MQNYQFTHHSTCCYSNLQLPEIDRQKEKPTIPIPLRKFRIRTRCRSNEWTIFLQITSSLRSKQEENNYKALNTSICDSCRRNRLYTPSPLAGNCRFQIPSHRIWRRCWCCRIGRKEGGQEDRRTIFVFPFHGLPELPDDKLGFTVPGPFGDILALTRRRWRG